MQTEEYMKRYLIVVISFILFCNSQQILKVNSSFFSWSTLIDGIPMTCITSNSNHLFFVTNNEELAYQSKIRSIVSIDRHSGKIMFTKTFLGNEILRDICCNDKYLFVLSDQLDEYTVFQSTVYCYLIENGNLVWKNNYIPQFEGKVPLSILSSMFIGGDRLYFHINKSIKSVRIDTGEEVLSINNGQWYSKPIYANNNLAIFVSNDQFQCIENSNTKWILNTHNTYYYFGCLCEYHYTCKYNKFGRTFDKRPTVISENNELIFLDLIEQDEKKQDNIKQYLAALNINNGTLRRLFDVKQGMSMIEHFFKKDSYYISFDNGSFSSLSCHDSNGNLKWSRFDASIQTKYITLGLYKNFVVTLDFYLDKNPSITLLKLYDAEKAYSIDLEIKRIDNAILEGTDLFLFGDGKLQKIDLSQIDFSTNLKFNPTQGTYTQNGTTYNLDTPIEIKNNRVFISANNIFEPLCGKNEFENKEGIIKATLDDKTIELQINNPIAKVNGIEKQIDPNNQKVTPYVNSEGYILVPLRFVAESFGCKITFNPDTKEIIVTYQP